MSLSTIFLFGTLRHRPHLDVVLSHDRAATVPAVLLDHAVHDAGGAGYPFLVEQPGARAEGLVLRADATDRARLDFYEAVYGYALKDCQVVIDGQTEAALVYAPPPGTWEPGANWQLERWVETFGAVTIEAAREVMQAFGHEPPEVVGRYYDTILLRADSTLTARNSQTPVQTRTGLRADQVEMLSQEQSYRRYFAVEDIDFRFPRFDGSLSAPVTRAVFMMGDAVTVLPYDPVRDRVLMIEQHRVGPHLRGDPHPWTLEAVAGRIDLGETPEDCARREAKEEAGVDIGALHAVGRYYSSPGAVSEYLYSFIGITELPDAAAGIGGLDSEDEDIRGHILGFDEAMALIESGEAENGPLLLTLYALALRRDALRGLA